MLLLPYQVRHIVKKEKVTPTNPIDGVVSCPNTNRTSKKLAPGQLNRFYVMIGQLEIFWVKACTRGIGYTVKIVTKNTTY